MTVSTELSHEEYVGNGVTTDFDFRFRIFESRHLIVVVADNDGNETTLKNGTDYFIVGVGSYFGGKVVLSKPLAKDWKILLERDLPVVQETDLRNQGKFFAEVHEDAFDYLTMLIQKALGNFSLSLRKPTYLSNYYDAKGNRIANLASPKIGGDATNKDYVDNSIKGIDSKTLRVKDKSINALPNTEQRANKILAFDDNGQPITVLPESGSASDVLIELRKNFGTTLISHCPSVDDLRKIEPPRDGVRILVASHTLGYEIGGGWFYSVTNGSEYEDDNGCIIKTVGGSAWIRKVSDGVDATYYGLIPDDETKALTNSEAIVKAAEYAFKTGREVTLPGGIKYIDDCIINHPITIKGQSTRWASSLVNRKEPADIIHIGTGYAFDYPPKKRPALPTDTDNVVDGIHLENLAIRGTINGKGGWRVNDEKTGTSPDFSGRRNTSATNIQISGYYAGYGYRLYETYTNQLTNVVVWECAVPYYLNKAHATNHVSCVYENTAYGCLALSCFNNNHFGGTIEGVRPLSKMSEPWDYDNQGKPSFIDSYAGVAVRVRGGMTLLSGVYLEANVINGHIENNGELIIEKCFINDSVSYTDYSFIGSAGRFIHQHNRQVGNAKKGWIVKGDTSCTYAEVISNSFVTSTKPTSIPNISPVGVFDTYTDSDSNVDSNMFTRHYLGMRSRNVTSTPSSTNNIPIITESEQTRLRMSSVAYSNSDRTVELYPSSKTGCVLIPQGGGFLTLSNNQDYINNGLELTVMISNTGSSEVSINGRNGFKQFSANAPSGEMTILKFISYNGLYYKI